LIPLFFAFKAVRRYMFRTMSQTAVNYLESNLSQGRRAGTVHGGDRLQWVKTELDGADSDNFAPLMSLDWQVHVYRDAAPEIQAECDPRKLSLYSFPWSPSMDRAGLRRDALYLVRPDGYVAVANPEGSATALASYFDARKLYSAV
jgi:hypothetical protein